MLTAAAVRGSSFSDCFMQYSSFSQAVVQKTVFSGCNLVEADFSDLKCRDLSLVSCRLERAAFMRTRLRDIDLSSSDLSSLFISDNLAELRGARLDLDQWIQLAGLLQIRLH